MQAVVADAMAGGAAGFASSASPTHNGDSGRPVPSRVADLAELRALLEPVKQCRARAWWPCCPAASSPTRRSSGSSARSAGPFTWTALLTVKGYPYHEKVVAEHDAAWADGVEVWPQVSCRPLVFQMNLSEPFTLNMRPTFAALMGKSKAERVAAYRDPSWRATAWEDVSGKAGGFPLNWAVDLGGRVARRTPSWPTTRWPCWPRSGAARRSTSCSTSRSTTTSRPASGRCWPTTTPRPSPGCCRATTCCSAWPTPGAHVSQLCDACFSTDLLGQLGARPRRHAAGAGHPQADRRAGRRLRPVRPGDDRGGQGRRPVRVRPRHGGARARCAGSATSRPTASASPPTQPVGMTHTLVNGVPIRVDGAADDEGLAARPGAVLRS